MNNGPSLFTSEEIELFGATLHFLARVCAHQRQARQDVETQGDVRDVLLLNITKVVNDCYAILLLARSGFYVQAGILARSTTDACSLVMHIDVERDEAELAERWLEGRRVTHWMLVETLKEARLDMDSYRVLRRRLDDLVHANYEGLKLYPAQLAKKSQIDEETFQQLTFWKGLIYFYLITCLLALQLLAPELETHAEKYLVHLVKLAPAP